MSKFHDGQMYDDDAVVPDMGSLVCTSTNNLIRNYEGLAADVDKLPKYDNLETGSSFFAIDTGAVYKYVKANKTWYAL